MGRTSRRGSAASVLAVAVSALVIAILGACSSNDAPSEKLGKVSAALTTSLTATADTYLRQGAPNQNQGTETFPRLQASGHNRALVRFDTAAVASLAPGSTVTLQLVISANAENWSTAGRPIAVHRLRQDWTEVGATWNCAVDTNTSNASPDCAGATQWEMDRPNEPALHPWVEPATATATITNGQTGIVTFDVTADVALFRSGTPNYGWIIKKVDEGAAGRVEFASRETSTPPLLVGPGGHVLDPTLGATFPSADAWQQAIVGNNDVLISRSAWPPTFGPAQPGDTF